MTFILFYVYLFWHDSNTPFVLILNIFHINKNEKRFKLTNTVAFQKMYVMSYSKCIVIFIFVINVVEYWKYLNCCNLLNKIFFLPCILIFRYRHSVSTPKNIHRRVSGCLTNQACFLPLSNRQTNSFFFKCWRSWN